MTAGPSGRGRRGRHPPRDSTHIVVPHHGEICICPPLSGKFTASSIYICALLSAIDDSPTNFTYFYLSYLHQIMKFRMKSGEGASPTTKPPQRQNAPPKSMNACP
eukprot:scaffold1879_cov97-Skeletonema_marinoi.AAC.7